MSKYALNISEDGRVLSATYEEYADKDAILVDFLPDGDITCYRYIDGSFVYDASLEPQTIPEEQKVTTDDILNTLLGVTE